MTVLSVGTRAQHAKRQVRVHFDQLVEGEPALRAVPPDHGAQHLQECKGCDQGIPDLEFAGCDATFDDAMDLSVYRRWRSAMAR